MKDFTELDAAIVERPYEGEGFDAGSRMDAERLAAWLNDRDGVDALGGRS